MRYARLAAVGVLALWATVVWADAPMADLRQAVDAALKVLQNPTLRGAAHAKERREQLSRIAEQAFDLREISQRVLARAWRERTASEREEFTATFRQLLEYTYSELLSRYNGEKVVYLDQQVDGDFARVRTHIITPRGTQIPVSYTMARRDGRWVIVDVSVENVSYVANYRSQFSEILQNSSFPGLLKRIRAKVETLRRQEDERASGKEG